MVLEEWLTLVLQHWGFNHLNDVIVLRRERNPAQPVTASAAAGICLRPAKSSDVDALTSVDSTAFAPPWQYSRTVIRQAMTQATLATVAEVGHEIVGYQISSGGREGGHLARLAVRPDMQGRGIGRALAAQVVEYFEKRGAPKITVNTQRDNSASISIYHALGFAITDEHYAVWQRILIP
jgi:ribosomal protein S18 acetylase RimI-like enzyme